LKKELTDRQRAILEYIRRQVGDRGMAPTIREIGRQFAIASTNGVRTHLTALARKGYIKKHDHLSRGLELIDNVVQSIGRVPLVGSVPAGLPIDAIENIEGEIAVDLSFLPKGDSFALNVVGDSMINAGIHDGDTVLVKKQKVAQRGEIVVAIIDEEATVKRYFPTSKHIRLQPENDDFEPIIVNHNSGQFRIAGKVVGLLRKFN